MTITDRPMTVHRDDAAIDALLPRGIEDDPLLLQRASDPLVRLAADVAERRLDAESPAMGSYHGWLVEEAERQSRAGDELTEAHAAALLDRVRPALQAGRLGIRLESGRPLERSTARTEAGSMSDRDARDAPWFDLQVAAGAGRELWDHPAERWIEVPDLCPPGQYVALSVSGDSMQPLFHPGDILLVRRGPEVARDTVIVARHPDDGYVVKEVGRLTRSRIELRSINEGFPTVTIPRDPALVLGTVLMRWCDHGRAPAAR